MIRIIPGVFALLCGISTLAARDFCLTVQGAGSRDGSNWENAIAGDHLQTVFNDMMRPGDRLLLGSGDYKGATLVILHGGKSGKPKELVGVDRGKGRPVFTGNWKVESPSKGLTAIRIEPGVSHLGIRSICFRDYACVVNAPAAPNQNARSHLAFEDLGMERFRYGFFLADCAEVELRGCVLKRYTKHGFRFDQGCRRIKIERCLADCSEGDPRWETRTELFPFGYFLNDGGRPNATFVFEDSVARNHMMPMQKTKYKNGDGFVVEENASDVRFVRCRSIRNQDGGFDLKARDVRLIDCVAVGNSRGFRIWSTGTLENCFAGWSAVGLWNDGGPVRANHCTFHMLKDAAVVTDDAATSSVILDDSLITATPTTDRHTGNGSTILRRTIVIGGNSNDAGYLVPKSEWDGFGNAMNSQAHPDKGYRNSPCAKRTPHEMPDSQ